MTASTRHFGERKQGVTYVVRPAVYAVILAHGSVACVRATSGLFLPGGGLESGEDAETAIHREVREECGRSLTLLGELPGAVQLFGGSETGRGFELRASFYRGVLGDRLDLEPEHDVLWGPVDGELPALYHECHRWAVSEALRSTNG